MNLYLFILRQVNFQWNGITSKRKGQQWGKEKTTFHKRSDQKKQNPECSDMLINEEEEKEEVQEKSTVDVPVEFDKLKPCSTLPQVCCLMPCLRLNFSSFCMDLDNPKLINSIKYLYFHWSLF